MLLGGLILYLAVFTDNYLDNPILKQLRGVAACFALLAYGVDSLLSKTPILKWFYSKKGSPRRLKLPELFSNQ